MNIYLLLIKVQKCCSLYVFVNLLPDNVHDKEVAVALRIALYFLWSVCHMLIIQVSDESCAKCMHLLTISALLWRLRSCASVQVRSYEEAVIWNNTDVLFANIWQIKDITFKNDR